MALYSKAFGLFLANLFWRLHPFSRGILDVVCSDSNKFNNIYIMRTSFEKLFPKLFLKCVLYILILYLFLNSVFSCYIRLCHINRRVVFVWSIQRLLLCSTYCLLLIGIKIYDLIWTCLQDIIYVRVIIYPTLCSHLFNSSRRHKVYTAPIRFNLKTTVRGPDNFFQNSTIYFSYRTYPNYNNNTTGCKVFSVFQWAHFR